MYCPMPRLSIIATIALLPLAAGQAIGMMKQPAQAVQGQPIQVVEGKLLQAKVVKGEPLAEKTGAGLGVANPVKVAGMPLYSVKFNGGSVGDYLEAIRAGSEGSPLNVTCSEEVLNKLIGSVTLEKVNLHTALNAVAAASTDPNVSFQAQALDYGLPRDTGALPAYSLVMSKSSSAQRKNSEVKTFSLREYVGEAKGDAAVKRATSLISAVEAALGSDESAAQRWVVKFHPDSNLLIVRGNPDDIAVANQVVTQLVSETVNQGQEDRRRTLVAVEREKALEMASKMLYEADRQRKESAAMAEAAQKQLNDGSAKDGRDHNEAWLLLKEAEENFTFRRDQYRRIEELAKFGNVVQSGSSQAEAKVRELEVVIVKLRQQVQELQQLLNEKSHGDGGK